MGYIAFQLTDKTKKEILNKFKPNFNNVKCHHITYKFGVPPTYNLPSQNEGYIVGYKKGDGVEALVVEINGKIIRPDGKIYHITLSHDNEHKPVHSNNLLSDNKYLKFDSKIKIYFKSGYFK